MTGGIDRRYNFIRTGYWMRGNIKESVLKAYKLYLLREEPKSKTVYKLCREINKFVKPL